MMEHKAERQYAAAKPIANAEREGKVKIQLPGVTLAYQKAGTGAPLLLLHGNGEDGHIFDVIVEKLKPHFTTYQIDSRNHGESTKTDDFSYEAMAQDIYEFIKALHLPAVHLLGFSDGAILSLILAMHHGECVQKMALLGVNLSPKDFTQESYEFVKQTYEETQDPLFRLMLEQPNLTLDQVKSVTAPALVVAAEHDIFRPETFDQLTQALPNARLLRMQGHEHDSYIVNQDVLYPDLMTFFQ